ncbi:MAG: acylphosphatase [Candidatus Bathyarchaeia archaeon]|jgi:acylphosphatase
MKTRVHVFVSGRVQGVFFRQKTKQQAESFGVTGWVRNLPDGRVETVFEGEEEAVKALVEYCHHGPSYARVTNIDASWEDYRGEFSDFKMR